MSDLRGENVDPRVLGTGELAEEVKTRRRLIEAAESLWMSLLVEFDRRRGWAADGCLSAVDWLVLRCGMARPTAKEKLRVAYQLERRPVLAEAYAAGNLSYSKVRALTRITDADDETDSVLLEAAGAATAADLENLVRHWEALLEQEDNPEKAMRRWERRGLTSHRRFDGMGEIRVVAPIEHTARLVAAVDAYLRRQAVGKVPAENPDIADPVAHTSWAQRRADALVDLIEETVERLDTDPDIAFNADACLVNVLVDYERLVEKAAIGLAEIDNGAPLTGEAARRLACDAGLVRIITKGRSEVLDVGQQTRQWNTAQRRAIRARHRHRCAIAGCDRRINQIHHTVHVARGGATDVDLGVPLCYGHHHLVHEGGWSVAYDPATGATTLTSPTGRRITSHLPPDLRQAA